MSARMGLVFSFRNAVRYIKARLGLREEWERGKTLSNALNHVVYLKVSGE